MEVKSNHLLLDSKKKQQILILLFNLLKKNLLKKLWTHTKILIFLKLEPNCMLTGSKINNPD